ncbi:MAG: sigma-70 family RNA polymerase sigma factor [Phycisphaeraceae bacterium]|nr:sigma-70 family RNA polymerase sigma factor [Phycisphaeraceae bacterium]
MDNAQRDEEGKQASPGWVPPKPDVIYDKYNEKVYNFCLQKLYNSSDAEDAKQHVFYKLMSYSTNSFQHETQFVNLIFRIASSTCIDILRKRRSRHEQASRVQVGDLAAPTKIDDSAGKHGIRFQQRLGASLDVPVLEVLLLRIFRGMTYHQIAAALDISLDNAKMRGVRAKERFVKIFARQDRLECCAPCAHVHLAPQSPRVAIAVCAVSLPVKGGKGLLALVESDTFENRPDPEDPWLDTSKTERLFGCSKTVIIEHRSGGEAQDVHLNAARSASENGASWIVSQAAKQQTCASANSTKRQIDSSTLVQSCEDEVLALNQLRRLPTETCNWFRAIQESRS